MQLSRVASVPAALTLLVALAGSALADAVPGVPGLSVAVTHVSEHTPVFIVNAAMHATSQGNPGEHVLQCVDFRVLSRKPVTAVRFTVHFRDDFNNEHFPGFNGRSAWNLDRRGFFNSGEVVRANFDPSTTYVNDETQSCWIVPTTFDVGLSQITKMSIETTQVAFADGSVWRAGQSFDQAFFANGQVFVAGATPAPSATTRPAIRVSESWATAGHAPVEGLGATTGYDFGGDPEQCVTFRNVSNQAATSVDFDVVYTDASNNRVSSQTVSHVGTFSPSVLIENKCRNVRLGNADAIRRMAHATLHVRRVVFNDGTEWREGQAFTRVFGNNGDRLAAPLAVAAVTAPVVLGPASPATLPPVQVGGGNGSVVQPGAHYGAIAISPTASIWAVATDRESPGAAMADAVDQCNARAGSNVCTSQLQFSAEKCGAIAMRQLQGVPVIFLGTANTKRDAEANALTKAGNGSGVLASGCNT